MWFLKHHGKDIDIAKGACCRCACINKNQCRPLTQANPSPSLVADASSDEGASALSPCYE